ncbi:UNVERIFIED_CONTAM: hypothetical protein FKN15_023015 [Acipenser sinensis]
MVVKKETGPGGWLREQLTTAQESRGGASLKAKVQLDTVKILGFDGTSSWEVFQVQLETLGKAAQLERGGEGKPSDWSAESSASAGEFLKIK